MFMGTNDTATRRFVGQFAKVTGAESKPRRINPERPPTSLTHMVASYKCKYAILSNRRCWLDSNSDHHAGRAAFDIIRV